MPCPQRCYKLTARLQRCLDASSAAEATLAFCSKWDMKPVGTEQPAVVASCEGRPGPDACTNASQGCCSR